MEHFADFGEEEEERVRDEGGYLVQRCGFLCR